MLRDAWRLLHLPGKLLKPAFLAWQARFLPIFGDIQKHTSQSGTAYFLARAATSSMQLRAGATSSTSSSNARSCCNFERKFEQCSKLHDTRGDCWEVEQDRLARANSTAPRHDATRAALSAPSPFGDMGIDLCINGIMTDMAMFDTSGHDNQSYNKLDFFVSFVCRP